MGLAAKRFLQIALRQRPEHRDPVIPMNAVVIENEARNSSGTFLPMNIKSIRITHQSIAMPPPILKIVIEQYQTHGLQGTIDGPEMLRKSFPKPTIARSTSTEKALRNDDIDKETINSKSTAAAATTTKTEPVLSSPILLETHGSERSHSATDQASGEKRSTTPNRKHQTKTVTIPKSDTNTTETKKTKNESKHDSLASGSSDLNKDPTPKELKTHCNEGSYWSNDLSGKKRSISKRRVIQSVPIPKELQSHCAEGRYWEIGLSSNKRKRSPSAKLMESSLANITKRKKQTRTASSRR